MSARADSKLPQAPPAAAPAPTDRLDRIIDILAERALQETAATSVAIGLLGDGGVTCRATAGLPITAVGDSINHDTGLTGLAIQRQMSQWCTDTETDARADQEVCRQLGVRSIIVVPVVVQDSVVGVFAICSADPDALSLADLNVVKKLSHWISEAAGYTLVKNPPATIASDGVARQHPDQQPPTIFNSPYARESGLRNYASGIWRATAKVLLGRQRGRAS